MDDAVLKALRAAIGRVDWGTPHEVGADGSRSWNLRFKPGILPYIAPVVPVTRQKGPAENERVTIDPKGPGVGSGGLPEGASGDTGSADERPIADYDPGPDELPVGELPGSLVVVGLSSSTSVDFFNTEMSERCLRSQAAQMIRGIPLLPRHNNGMFGASIEWDEVIGRTFNAEVIPAQVSNPFDAAERGFILRTESRLYDEALSRSLVRRLARSEPVGQSIGGWFTLLRVTEDADGEVIRTVIEDLELDHLAVTRAPANPDAMGMVNLSAIGEMVVQARSRADERPLYLPHVISIQGNEVLCDKVDLAELVGRDAAGKARDLFAIPVADRPAFARNIEAIEDGGEFWRITLSSTEELDQALSPGSQAEQGAMPTEAVIETLTETEAVEPEIHTSEIEVHDPIVSECAKVETADGRVVLSYDANASDDSLRSAFARAVDGELGPELARVLTLGMGARSDGPTMVDNSQPATYPESVQTPGGADAQRSALPTNLGADLGANDPENTMPITPEELRQIVNDAVKPLTERLDTIEQRSAPPAQAPAPVPVPAPVVEGLTAEQWEARAKAAENTVVHLTRGHRVGRTVTPMIPNDVSAGGVYGGLIERARDGAPTLAAVAEDVAPSILNERGGDPKARKANLEDDLKAVLRAAETDGIITNPFTRASAGWR